MVYSSVGKFSKKEARVSVKGSSVEEVALSKSRSRLSGIIKHATLTRIRKKGVLNFKSCKPNKIRRAVWFERMKNGQNIF